MSQDIYKTITFLNGDKCSIILPSLADWSRSIEKYNAQKNKATDEDNEGSLDMYPFMIERLCRFNGQKKDLEFILKLSGDMYFAIIPEINELMNRTI